MAHIVVLQRLTSECAHCLARSHALAVIVTAAAHIGFAPVCEALLLLCGCGAASCCNFLINAAGGGVQKARLFLMKVVNLRHSWLVEKFASPLGQCFAQIMQVVISADVVMVDTSLLAPQEQRNLLLVEPLLF